MSTRAKLSSLVSSMRSRATGAVIKQVVGRLHIPDSAVRNFGSWGKLSASGGGFPTELLPLGADMWSGFILTTFAGQVMEGWVLPYWLRCQTSPSSSSFVPHGHSWLTPNLTHRDWTGIGICGFPNEAIVDPRGLLTPWPFAPSIDVWVKVGDELVCPSELEHVEQKLIDGLPMVRTQFDALGLECSVTAFVAPLDTMPVVLATAEVTNAHCQAIAASLVVSVRPYNPESLCAINDLAYDPVSRTFTAEANPVLYLPAQPSRVIVSDLEHGDVATLIRDPGRERPRGLSVREPTGLATAAVIYELNLDGGGDDAICFACPLTAGVHPSFNRMLPVRDALKTCGKKLAEQGSEWSELTSRGMRISVPDEAVQKSFDLNKAFLLMLFDGKAITPGPSTYHMMWFRDAAYLVPALDLIGSPDMAADVLSTYPDRQTETGFFRSHDAEWDSNGQAMWTMVRHFLMTRDAAFLRDVYPSILKGAEWLDSMLQKDLEPTDPRHGLLPAGVSAEHFGANDVYYWDDLWAVAGLRAGASAALELCHQADARFMRGLADDLWACLEESWSRVERRLGRKVIPCAPGRDVDAGAIGSVAATYPLELIDATAELMRNTVDELVERCFYQDMHFHRIMHQGLNAYMSLQVAQCYLRRRDPYALAIFDAVWRRRTATFTYPEAINPLSGGGAYGDGHHGWAVAELVSFTRNLMLFEEGEVLVLLPVPSRKWFEHGNHITVEDAPTLFGPVSFSVDCPGSSAVFDLPGSFERAPVAIELNVPFEITSCEADGEEIEVRGKAVLVSPSAHTVTIGYET